METDNCGFLASVLGSAGSEDTSHLSDQSIPNPEPPGSVQQGSHLGGHVSVACRSPENRGI